MLPIRPLTHRSRRYESAPAGGTCLRLDATARDNADGPSTPSPRQLTLHSLSLISDGAPGGRVSINLEQPTAQLEALKENPITIKEGVDYNVSISFS